jgi:ribosomal protein L40E
MNRTENNPAAISEEEAMSKHFKILICLSCYRSRQKS